MTSDCLLSCTAPAVRRLVIGVLAALALAGCSGVEPVATHEQITDPAQLYMRLRIDHRAVNMSTVAPYDTLQLRATPQNALGDPLPGLPAPTFRLQLLSDSTKLTVTPAGLLQARAATGTNSANAVIVIAELAVPGNVRHADTMRVFVITTPTPPPQLASLAFEITPSDSYKVTMELDNNVVDFDLFPPFQYLFRLVPDAVARDAGGNVISEVLYEATSLDPAIAEVGDFPVTGGSFPLQVSGYRPGQARIAIRTTAYGVTLVDTGLVTVTWPVLHSVQLVAGLDGAPPRFHPSDVRIAPHGMVLWQNTVEGDSVDITFEDPTNVTLPPAEVCDNFVFNEFFYGPGPHCGTGNVLMPGLPAPDPNIFTPILWTDQLRQFPEPGVYRYHSTRTGATGRIVVTDNPDPAALP